MNQHSRQLRYFFSGQTFTDGVRITVSILLPAVLLGQWGHFAEGLTISTGAVCLSVTDTPGPVGHRRNGMLAALVVVASTALLTSVAALNIWTLALEIGVLSFGLTMLLVWGARAGAVGTAGLLNAVLLLGAPPPPLSDALLHAGLLLLGGLWYAGLALLAYQVRPYRPAQQALGECIHALARFLELKARFYEPRTDLDDDYRQLVAQQVVVNEKQEATRDFLFRTRQIVNETTSTGRRLVLTFVETVDLYERITVGYYDYSAVRTEFARTGVLADVARLIRHVATELDHLGVAIQANHAYHGTGPALTAEWERLQVRISGLDAEAAGNTRVLKKILVNLRDIIRRVGSIRRYFDEALTAAAPATSRATEHTRFVAHQEIELRTFAQNLTMSSAVFRHAVRMTVACLVAFIVAETLWHGLASPSSS